MAAEHTAAVTDGRLVPRFFLGYARNSISVNVHVLASARARKLLKGAGKAELRAAKPYVESR